MALPATRPAPLDTLEKKPCLQFTFRGSVLQGLVINSFELGLQFSRDIVKMFLGLGCQCTTFWHMGVPCSGIVPDRMIILDLPVASKIAKLRLHHGFFWPGPKFVLDCLNILQLWAKQHKILNLAEFFLPLWTNCPNCPAQKTMCCAFVATGSPCENNRY